MSMRTNTEHNVMAACGQQLKRLKRFRNPWAPLIPAHNEHTAYMCVKDKQTIAYLSAGIKLNLTFIIHNCIYVATTYAV